MTMSEQKFTLDLLFGHTELSTRFVPCTCGREYCGKFMNRIKRYEKSVGGVGGVLVSDVEEEGLVLYYGDKPCDGIPPKQTFFEKYLAWL